jgi:hypothetical protein
VVVGKSGDVFFFCFKIHFQLIFTKKITSKHLRNLKKTNLSTQNTIESIQKHKIKPKNLSLKPSLLFQAIRKPKTMKFFFLNEII